MSEFQFGTMKEYIQDLGIDREKDNTVRFEAAA